MKIIMAQADDVVSSLLQDWGLPYLIEDFVAKGIDIEVLKELTVSDIDNLIASDNFGLRIKFRTKLFHWKRENGYVTPLASTDSINSPADSLNSWLDTVPVVVDDSLKDKAEYTGKLDLLALLNNNPIGKLTLQKYTVQKVLSNSDRNVITGIIAEFWLNSNVSLTSNLYDEAVDEIKKLFPTESERTYLNTKTQRGKLAEKYYSLSKKLRKAGLIKSRYNLKRKYSEDIPSLTEDEGVIEADYDYTCDYEWLRYNISPEEFVYEKWNRTFALRRKTVLNEKEDIFIKWPILKQKIAVSLIELDFDRIHPEKNALLFRKWDNFVLKIKTIYNRDIKDKRCNLLLEKVALPTTNEDSKNYILAVNLNALLLPHIIKRGKQKSYRPSILDAQNTFAAYVTDKTYIQTYIEDRKAELVKYDMTFQPTVIVVGATLQNLTNFYIYINDVLYQVESFLKAVSVTFQIYHVFNLKYPPECIQAWQFFEKYFYELTTSEKVSTSLTALLSEMEN